MYLRLLEFFRNNKKLILIVAISILVIVALVLLYFFVFKDSKLIGGKKKVKIATSTITGLDLIDKEYKNGNIDYETSLVSKVKYFFGDEKLNKEYVAKTKPFEDNGTFNAIAKNYSTLSEKTKKELKPYLVRPTDSESFLYKKYTAGSKVSNNNKKFGIIDYANADDRPIPGESGQIFKYLTTNDNKIKVWYRANTESNTTSASIKKTMNKVYLDKAKVVIAGLNTSKAYSKLKTLLNAEPPTDGTLGGDGKLDIYLDSSNSELQNTSGDSDAYGVNIPDVSLGKGSSFIIVDTNATKDVLNSTVVHEIFHAFQRYFILDDNKDQWWIEATATWSEEFIYPNINDEHDYVKEFIQNPEKSLTDSSGLREYGAYLFPLYLTKTYGNVIMTKIFKATEVGGGQPITQTIGQVIPSGNATWIHGFKNFALWNYNLNPVQYYKLADKSGKFPTNSSGDNSLPMILDYPQALTLKAKKMVPMSSQVLMFENLIINKDVNKIEVTNVWSQKNDVNKSYAGAKAIIYPKKGNAYVEDWTDKLTRDFCLNKESSRSENIKSITLVLSNAGISEGFPAGSFIVQGKKNSKDCKKEEKKTGKYIIQGSDTRLRTETTLDVKTGGTYEIKTTCTFTVTGKQVGGGLGAKIPEYQWVDKYAVSYKHTCNSSWPYGTASDVKTGSGFIDLTVSFALLYSLSDPNPSADIENSTESYSSVDGFGNKDSGTRKEGTAYYGWLENYTKNGTEIHFNFYDWDTDYTDGTKLDHSDVIIKVIGQ